jgi:hypothetical protein
MTDLEAVLAEMRRRLPDNPDHDAHAAHVYLNPRMLRDWIARIEQARDPNFLKETR